MNNLRSKSTQELKEFIGGFGDEYLKHIKKDPKKGERNYMLEYKALIVTNFPYKSDRVVPQYFEEFNTKLEACRIISERKDYAKKKEIETMLPPDEINVKDIPF